MIDTLTWIDYAKLIGFLSVVIATIFSTVCIPRLQDKIDKYREKVLKFRDDRINTVLCLTDYAEKFTRRRIELMEGNMVFLIRNDGDTQAIIHKRAVNQTYSLARQHAMLNSGTEGPTNRAKIDEEYKAIIANDDLNLSQKLEQTEKIWREAQKGSFDRFHALQKNSHKNEVQIAKLEKKKQCWSSAFAWFQIVGLILFSGAEVFGKIINR